jgi:Dyp-type peroxidase family
MNSHIQEKYTALGGQEKLGYKITKPIAAARDSQYQHFERGTIYSHPEAGTHAISGKLRNKWNFLAFRYTGIVQVHLKIKREDQFLYLVVDQKGQLRVANDRPGSIFEIHNISQEKEALKDNLQIHLMGQEAGYLVVKGDQLEYKTSSTYETAKPTVFTIRRGDGSGEVRIDEPIALQTTDNYYLMARDNIIENLSREEINRQQLLPFFTIEYIGGGEQGPWGYPITDATELDQRQASFQNGLIHLDITEPIDLNIIKSISNSAFMRSRVPDLTKPLELISLLSPSEFLLNLQGNILQGNGRQYSVLLFFRLDPEFPNSARSWLRYFATQKVTSALEQYQASRRKQETGKEELFAAVLLSAAGYRALGYSEDELPTDGSDSFKNGMASRPLNDPPKDKWEPPYDGEIHAMILLAHEDYGQLKREVQAVEKQLERFCEMIHREEGRKQIREINGKKRVVEHFGYADGISQPIFIRPLNPETASASNFWNPEASLDMVLVKEPQSSQTYGSFMVFRKLEQHVSRFAKLVQEMAPHSKISEEQTGARLIGRDKAGKPLRPNWGEEDPLNDFDFSNDEEGIVCPLNSHIRRMNPRDKDKPVIQIARRGITYGDQRNDWDEPDISKLPDANAGLLFMSFQSKLENFEVLHGRVQDTIFTQENNLVTFKGGEYFFAPSLPFLRNLKTIDSLTDHQISHFRYATEKLSESTDTIREFASKWKLEGRLAAVAGLGIQPQDFDIFYAYLVPYMALIDGYEEGLDQSSEVSTAQVQPEEVLGLAEQIAKGFIQLLEPDKLEEFSYLWKSDPDKALGLVELTREQQDAFYTYLKQFEIDFKLLIWA